jgi:phosphoenolpyruvate carboxylase
MAEDVALAPIGSVRRTQVGREATEPMREDIRLLGAILGDTVREQNGEEVFDLVERARVESFRVRRSEIDRAELARMFDGIDIHQAIPVIRAFSHFALLANVAEDIHRERRRAVHVAVGEPPQNSSLAATYRKLDSAELDSATVADALTGALVSPVITAHPTETRRRTVFDTQHRITELMRLRLHGHTQTEDGRAAPPHPHVVADRADPVVAVEDSGRDRDRAALLSGRALRSHPAGQCGGADGAADPLARRRSPRRADAAARFVDRR